MPIQRICLTPIGTYGPDYNITVDLYLSESGVPTDRMTAFGVRGSLREDSENEPFLLFRDGSGDFGSGWEDERDFQLNLRGNGRAVRINELFTFESAGEQITYRVTQIIELQ